jgi:hypothetical protein
MLDQGPLGLDPNTGVERRDELSGAIAVLHDGRLPVSLGSAGRQAVLYAARRPGRP